MSLQIQSISKTEERISLLALNTVNIHGYAIADNTYKGDKVSNVYRHFYRFPDKIINKGDFVRLFTKEGKNCSYPNKGGTTTYEFYMGSKGFIWNDNETDRVELLMVQTVENKAA